MTTARLALINIFLGLSFACAMIALDWFADRGFVPGFSEGHTLTAWLAIAFVLVQSLVNTLYAVRPNRRESGAPGGPAHLDT